jgi:PAS domain S-box-containing protein
LFGSEILGQKLDEFWATNKKTFTELFIIIIIAVNIFMFSTYIELYDRIAELNQQYEPFHLDGLVWVIFFLILAFANFSWHRYRELQVQIEERKKAESSLRESEAKYSALVEHSKDAIVIVQDGLIKFANRGFLEIIGSTPHEILLTKFEKWVDSESKRILKRRNADRKAMKDIPSIYELVINKTGGTKVPVEINSTIIDFEGEHADLVVIRNITERKLMEAKIQRYTTELESLVTDKTKELKKSYKRLQKVDQMRSEFIDVAAHELRTPLTSIKAYIDLMRSGHVGKFSNDEEPTLGDMNTNINGLNKLINEMLDYTKTEGKLLEMSFNVASLAELAKEVVTSFTIIAKSQNISINLDCKGPINVHIDKDMMMKVFINLIGNAIKYSREGGKVTIKIKSDKGQVLVTVADTGVGIKKDELPFIFERFYMGDTSLTREKDPDQLGFGLSIVRSIIDRHGGKIWVESQEGKGSKFYFTLPK